MKKYVDVKKRIYADIDNERIDEDVVGLTKTDFVKNFLGEEIFIYEGEYIYMYMNIDDFPPDYVFAEGVVIKNPYNFKPYKWCCKIMGKIEYIEEYNERWNNEGNVSD